MVPEPTGLHGSKFGSLLHSDPFNTSTSNSNDETDYSHIHSITFDYSHRHSNASAVSPIYYDKSPASSDYSPYVMSPWNQSSPYNKSPWIAPSPLLPSDATSPRNCLIGSLVRKEGHIYSLAVSGDLLYTGSDSKNIRVWKNLNEYTGFESNSGLVKAIIVFDGRIFTGHQDGKIRVWKVSHKDPRYHKRIGSLPTFKDLIKSSIKPKNYVEVRRRRNALRIKHYDAVSCMSLSEEHGILYSGSWDRTVKAWRIDDLKCLESFTAHDDAVNAVVSGFDSLVFTGSADGTVKVWRREEQRKRTKHVLVQILLKQENAVTALAVSGSSGVIYCGSSDGLVSYWERKGKRLIHGGVLRGHKLAVLCVVAAGNLVLSGSADKNICVWRREDEKGFHTCLSVLTGHAGPVKCLAVDEENEEECDDRRWIVYSGSLDKSVKVWRVSENQTELRKVSFFSTIGDYEGKHKLV